MKVAGIQIVVGSLGTVFKNLEKRRCEQEIKERIETIQTTAVLKSFKILRRILEIGGDFIVTQTPVKNHQLGVQQQQQQQ